MRCDRSSPSTSSITSACTPSDFFETVDRGDVRMIQRREGLGFARETRQSVGVGGERVGQHLDRDVAIQLRVARPIHLAHAAGPKGGQDFVRAKTCAEVEGQTAGTSIGQGGASTALLLSDAEV